MVSKSLMWIPVTVSWDDLYNRLIGRNRIVSRDGQYPSHETVNKTVSWVVIISSHETIMYHLLRWCCYISWDEITSSHEKIPRSVKIRRSTKLWNHLMGWYDIVSWVDIPVRRLSVLKTVSWDGRQSSHGNPRFLPLWCLTNQNVSS